MHPIASQSGRLACERCALQRPRRRLGRIMMYPDAAGYSFTADFPGDRPSRDACPEDRTAHPAIRRTQGTSRSVADAPSRPSSECAPYRRVCASRLWRVRPGQVAENSQFWHLDRPMHTVAGHISKSLHWWITPACGGVISPSGPGSGETGWDALAGRCDATMETLVSSEAMGRRDRGNCRWPGDLPASVVAIGNPVRVTRSLER